MAFRAARRVGTILTVVLATTALGAAPGGAGSSAAAVPLSDCYESDHAPPVLTGLRFAPRNLGGVRKGAPGALGLTATVEDAGGPGPASGVVKVIVATGLEHGNFADDFLRRVDGHTFRGALHFPPGVASARQTIDLVSVFDRAGNEASYELSDLRELGLPSTFTVRSRRVDRRPPQLVGLRLTPPVVDTRDGHDQTVRVEASARDDYSGISDVTVELDSGEDFTEDRVALHRTAANTWTGRLHIVAWEPSRTAQLTVEISERAHGLARLDSTALRRAGFPGQVRVLSRPDTRRPHLRLVSLTPRVLDARTASPTARVVVQARDVDSGIQRIQIIAGGASLADTLSFGGLFGPRPRLIAGTRHDGRWAVTIAIPPCRAPNGLRKIHIYAYDARHVARVAPRARFFGRDHSRPEAREVRTGPPGGPFSVEFSEDVTGVGPGSALVVGTGGHPTVLHPPPQFPGTWACSASSGVPVDCETGLLRTAVFTPTSPLRPNTSYRIAFNGPGSLALTDAAGNPIDDPDLFCGCGGTFFRTTG